MIYIATQGNPRIVVGVDGSPGSRTALRWAMTQARLLGARVEAVAAWQDPAVAGYAYGGLTAHTDESLASTAYKKLNQTIDEVSAELNCVRHLTCPVVVVPTIQE